MEVVPGGTGYVAVSSSSSSAGLCQCHVLQRMGDCLVIAVERSSAPEGAIVQLVTDGTQQEVSIIKAPKSAVTPTIGSEAHSRLPFDTDAHKGTLLMTYLALRDDVPTTDSGMNRKVGNLPSREQREDIAAENLRKLGSRKLARNNSSDETSESDTPLVRQDRRSLMGMKAAPTIGEPLGQSTFMKKDRRRDEREPRESERSRGPLADLAAMDLSAGPSSDRAIQLMMLQAMQNMADSKEKKGKKRGRTTTAARATQVRQACAEVSRRT